MTIQHYLAMFRIEVDLKETATLKDISDLIVEAQRRFYLHKGFHAQVNLEATAMHPQSECFSLVMKSNSKSRVVAEAASEVFEATFKHLEKSKFGKRGSCVHAFTLRIGRQ